VLSGTGETTMNPNLDSSVTASRDQAAATPTQARRLPVTYSILSADALLAYIGRAYGIPSPASCELLLPSMNDTYLLTASDRRYIVRVYRASWRTAAEIAYELDLLNYLTAQGVPVAAPIEGGDGRLFRSVTAPEGTRHIAVFDYADGEALTWTAADQCRSAGRLLAAIHERSSEFSTSGARAELDAERLITKSLNSIQCFFEQSPADWEYLSSFAAKLYAAIVRDGPRMDWGVCHGDFGGGNLVVANGALTAFDFDLCGPGWRACDLAAIRVVARTRKDNAIWERFAQGYGEVRTISPQDLQATHLFEPVRHLWRMGLQADHASEWGSVRLNETFLSSEVALFRRWEAEHLFDTWPRTADQQG
jgi:Ser/Thr protein kinase RdoA (MazF antagonist)